MDRTVVVRLRAEIAEYKRAMAEAAKASEEPGRRSQQTTEQATRGLGRLVQSAHQNEAAWQSVGQQLVGVGAATGAVYATLLKTGVAYNTLQQTSRAALTTMLGSAQAANEQMDKLDAFARTSPFAKQVFITAQRQMIGFGVETQKVLPYLDAIQNAVAAMGGSNHDVAELTRIMSQISASAKITATDLREFGNRGVDAATIIGSQMGKTGAQIREDITDGALDAQVALDALAAGMQARFGGAADNVKNTFEGALDRVKAAWRDLAAELADPLVSADGGGALVDLANDAADAVRWFQALPDPVKSTVTSFGALVTVGGLLGGMFLMLTPRILANVRAAQLMAREHPKAVRAVRAAGWVALAATIVSSLDEWGDSLRKARNGGDTDVAALATSLRNFATSGKIAGESARYLGEDFAELDEAFGQTSGWQSNLGRINESMGTWGWLIPPLKSSTQQWADALKDGNEKFEAFDAALTSLVSEGDLEIAAILQAEFAARAVEANWSVEQIAAALPGYTVALEDAKGANEGAADATGEFTEATQDAEAAAQAAADAYAEWFRVIESAAASFVDVVDAYDEVIQANIDVAQAAADATESSKDSWEDFYDGATVTAKEWIASLRDQVKAQQEWADNLVAAATKVRDELPAELQEAGQALVDEFAARGPEGAEALATFVEMGPRQREKIVRLSKETADLASGALQDQLDVARNPVLGLDIDVANAQAEIDRFIITQSGRRIFVDIHGRQTGFDSGPGNRIGRAGGGKLPGAPSSKDNMVINAASGEWVINARSSQKYDALLTAINNDTLPAFASGGRVGWARRQRDAAKGTYDEAREALKEAQRESRAASRTDDTRRKERARKAEQAAREAVREAESALRDARARVQRLAEQRRDLRTDLRRGEIREDVLGGRDSALGVVDELLDQSRNTDLSKKQRGRLADTAKDSERALERLYKQSERIENRLAKARDRVSELGQIASQVSGRLSGEQSLAASILTEGTTVQRSNARGDIWHETTSPSVTSASLVADAQARAAKIRAFAGKLSKLQQLGMSGVILQEIALLGSEQGSLVADAMIAGGKTDIAALNRAYEDIAKWSAQAGQYVTEGFYEGGLSAAEGLVKGLEDQQAAIEKQMLKIAKAMEKALKQALGIKSPSTKARAWMRDVGRGAELGLEDSILGVESKARLLAAAALPAGVNGHGWATPAGGSTGAVNVTVKGNDPQDIRDALNGAPFVLLVDGNPVKAIVQTEIGAAATAVGRGY